MRTQMIPSIPLVLFVLIVVLVAAIPLPAADRPQWGEAWSRNLASSETGLPASFDPEKGTSVLWSAPLGSQTYSTPVVAGGRVLIGTNNNSPRDPAKKGDRGILLCLDAKDGKLLWQLVVPKREEDIYLEWPNTGIVSAASAEGDRVYLLSNRAEVMCLDLDGMADGNDGPYKDEGRHMAQPGQPPLDVGPADADILWILDIPAAVGGRTHDNPCSSPLIQGPFLWIGTSNGVEGNHTRMPYPEAPGLIVIEKATGRLVAVDETGMGRRTIHCDWSSPSMGEVKGRPLVFYGGGDGLCYAFEALRESPPEGKTEKLREAWRFDCDPDAPKEDIFKWQDNRSEGPSNISGMPVFHEGRVYITAGGDVWHGKPRSWLKCIDASGSGDITRTGEVWSYPMERYCLSTPAIAGGLAYIADCGGKVHCVDIATGKACWVQDVKGEMWSSPLVADGKVYIGTQRETFWILAAGREKKVLATIEMDSALPPSPVAAGGILYVATMSRLHAIRRD